LTSPVQAPETPCAYNLAYEGPNGIVPAQHFSARPASLATVTERYYQDVPGTGYWAENGGFRFQLEHGVVFALVLPLKMPGVQLRYFSAGQVRCAVNRVPRSKAARDTRRMITASGLVQEVDGLRPRGRVQRVIAVARQLESADPAGLTVVLDEMARGEAYERRLAVLMAGAAGREQHLAGAADDQDPSVAALVLAAPGVPDALLRNAVERGSLQLRQLAYRRIRSGGKTALASSLVATARERWGDDEAAALLPACDPQTVRRLLPELAHAAPNWRTLVARHPADVAEFAEAELSGLDGPAAREWWQWRGPLVAALADAHPAAVLELAERRLIGPMPAALLQRLVRLLSVDPDRVLRLLLSDPDRAVGLRRLQISRRACARLARAADDGLAGLLRELNSGQRWVQAVLRAVPPARRWQIFDLAHAGQATETLLTPVEVLALLPAPRRYAEASRMLALPQVAKDQAVTLALTGLLPSAQARPVLLAAIGSADAEDRASGYALLINNVARDDDPAASIELLTWLARIRNERDPVRVRVLTAVAQLPYRLFTSAAVPALDQLVSDALNVRDASPATTAAISRLALRVLWQAAAEPDGGPLADWALGIMGRLGAWHARAFDPAAELLSATRRGQEAAVWHYLRTPLTDLLRRGQAWPLLRLAAVLGRRAWPISELQQLLGEAVQVNDDRVIREAVRLWLAAPRTRDERADQLIGTDPSTITLPGVLAVVTTSRTDLLDRDLLPARPLQGRFGTKGARWVPLVAPAIVARWNPRQQAAYRGLLHSAIADPGTTGLNRAAYVRALAAVPGGGAEAVADVIAGDDELLAEAALTGLGRAARPDLALPVLLAHVGGERARVAAFAASRCASYLAPEQLAGLLGPLLTTAGRVTVRKEAARLVARTRPPGAVDSLLSAWDRPGQHRDVRIALTASLVPFLPDSRVMSALMEAATSPDEHLATAIMATGWRQLPPSARPGYANLVRLVTRHREGPTASLALHDLAGWFRWAPAASAELHDRLLDLSRLDVWQAAAGCAADPAVWSAAQTLPADLAAALIERLSDSQDPGSTRDVPALQRIEQLVDAMCAHAADLRLTPEPALRLSAVLASHDLLTAKAAQLLVLLAAPQDVAPTHLEAAADLLAGRSATAARLAARLPAGDWTTDAAVNTAGRLARRGEPAAGLLAVALVQTAGERSGWTPAWRLSLLELRAHPQADVRDTAYSVKIARE
jgi:hypothetical protein